MITDRDGFVASIVADVLQHKLIAPGARVMVALSGGPDSCALLLALCEAAEQGLLPRPVGSAHFHHGLRGADADTDAAFSAALCARLGLPCVVGLGAVQSEGRSPNDAARRARYTFLAEAAHELEADRLATAHTADDQAETVLGRILRGTSVDGLAGIPWQRTLENGLRVIRPMLQMRRQQVEEYCAAQGITPRRDPSNEKERYTRSRLRRRIPELAQDFNPRLVEAMNRLSAHAAADADLLGTFADDLWLRAVNEMDTEGILLRRSELIAAHPALRRRVLLRALREVAGDTPYSAEVATDAWVDILEYQVLQGGIAPDLPGGIRAHRDADFLTLTRVSVPKVGTVPFTLPLSVPGTTLLPRDGGSISAEWLTPGTPPIRVRRSPIIDIAAGSACGKIGDGSTEPLLVVRNARPGDRIAPLGMQGKMRLIRDILAEANCPVEQRDSVPVVVRADTDALLWLVGIVQAESTRVIEETDPIMRLKWEKA